MSLLKHHYWNKHVTINTKISHACVYWNSMTTKTVTSLLNKYRYRFTKILMKVSSFSRKLCIFKLGVCNRIPHRKTVHLLNKAIRVQQNSHSIYHTKQLTLDMLETRHYLALDNNMLCWRKRWMYSLSFLRPIVGKGDNSAVHFWYLSAVHKSYMHNLATLLAD